MFHVELAASETTYYHDKLNFLVPLNQIQADVNSIAFVVFTRSEDSADKFRRKSIRLVDPDTKVELTLFPYRMDPMQVTSACKVAGMVLKNESWVFRPVMIQFPIGDKGVVARAETIWYQVLVANHYLA